MGQFTMPVIQPVTFTDRQRCENTPKRRSYCPGHPATIPIAKAVNSSAKPSCPRAARSVNAAGRLALREYGLMRRRSHRVGEAGMKRRAS
jgi:hypothetical protein